MRIAYGGIHTECSTYNPVLQRENDFGVVRGSEMTAAPYFAFLKDYDAEFLPTLHARAVPGGPVARDTYEAFKAEFLERLEALLPLDGLYLAMHGAVHVEGLEDAEGDWITAAREVVGPGCSIGASYDLHGNLTQRIIDALDMYSTYRTAPHIDVEQTQRRTVSMLVESLKTGIRPHIVWAPVPVSLPGERTSTVDEPARSLYALLPGIDARDGVWDASLNVGYVWADEPRVTAAAVLTGTDSDVLDHEATLLAQAYWDARTGFDFGCRTGSLSAMVDEALASPTGPVVLADSGDNPTGGGVGDRADMLAELIARGATDTIVAGITDLPAVEKAFGAGVGTTVRLTIGASLDPEGSDPVMAEAEVLNLDEGKNPSERQAVVAIGGITLVLAARRRPYHDFADFELLDLDPRTARIVVVKSGYLSPDLAGIANPNLMALSPGVVDQDVKRLPRTRKAHPTFPFDRDFAFIPTPIHSARAHRAAE